MTNEDSRGCDCPNCGGFADRLLKDDVRREDDTYYCLECGHVFTAKEYWKKANMASKQPSWSVRQATLRRALVDRQNKAIDSH